MTFELALTQIFSSEYAYTLKPPRVPISMLTYGGGVGTMSTALCRRHPSQKSQELRRQRYVPNMALEACSVRTNLPGLQETRIITPQTTHPLVFGLDFLTLIEGRHEHDT